MVRTCPDLCTVSDLEIMPNSCRLSALVALALVACGLGGCGAINANLAAGISDYVPQWAGGLPADAPPRPGSAKYDEYIRERERKRLEAAAPRQESNKGALDAVH